MSMTKKTARAFERLAESLIVPVLGPGAEYLDTGLAWSFPYADRGNVSLHLFRDSFDKGRVYRSSWLACRWNWDGKVGPDRYTLPRADVPGGWPGVFTYPSGKANYHPFDELDPEAWRRELALHLYSIAAPDSKEREGFGAIQFEPKAPAVCHA
jgi:hypothetical protein